MMKKYEPILNGDYVVAHHEDGSMSKCMFRKLKIDFLEGKIKSPVKFVYAIKINRNFHVTYHPTKGFRYNELKYGNLKKLEVK